VTPSRPVVILEAGAGGFSVDWSLVQPLVARFAQVCSYDRAGAGRSGLGPRPRAMRQQVWELHALLEHAGEKPPFVLAGTVLVDAGAEDPLRVLPGGKVTHAPSSPKGSRRRRSRTKTRCVRATSRPRIVGLIQSGIRRMAGHFNDPPRDKLPPEARRLREWPLSQIKHVASDDNAFEAEELAAILAERRNKQNVPGNLPLIVLSRGLPGEDGPQAARREEAHRKDQAAPVTLSSRGRQIVAAKSGHHVSLDEPGVVASAIREVVQAAAPTQNRGSRRESGDRAWPFQSASSPTWTRFNRVRPCPDAA